MGQKNHLFPTSQTTSIGVVSVAALLVAVATAIAAATAAPAAAQATSCGNAPAGFVVIESDAAIIRGTSGNDYICAGPGNNRISALAGDDIVIAGGGDDRVAGGKGDDTLLGGSGKDRLRGGAGDDVLQGGDGDDLLKGQPGSDQLSGGDGNDDLRAGPGTDSVDGGPGDDVANGQGGNDQVLGGAGNDVLRGKNGADFLDGGTGDDRANGGRGSDTCVAEEQLKCEPQNPSPEPEPEPEPPFDPDPDPEMTILTTSITNILDDHGPSHPWLLQAWDHISAQGEVVIADLPGSTAGTVETGCSFSTQELPTCEAVTFTMDRASLTDESVIIHELAHVYEGTLALHAPGGAFAKAQLYFDNTYGTGCDYAEAIADAMLHDVDPDAFLFYWEVGCANALPDQPTNADLNILRAGLAGGSGNTAWFDQNHADGAEAWTAMFDASNILSFYLVTGLRDEFGGYCSVGHTMSVVFDLQNNIVSDDNPFADGGC